MNNGRYSMRGSTEERHDLTRVVGSGSGEVEGLDLQMRSEI